MSDIAKSRVNHNNTIYEAGQEIQNLNEIERKALREAGVLEAELVNVETKPSEAVEATAVETSPPAEPLQPPTPQEVAAQAAEKAKKRGSTPSLTTSPTPTDIAKTADQFN